MSTASSAQFYCEHRGGESDAWSPFSEPVAWPAASNARRLNALTLDEHLDHEQDEKAEEKHRRKQWGFRLLVRLHQQLFSDEIQ